MSEKKLILKKLKNEVTGKSARMNEYKADLQWDWQHMVVENDDKKETTVMK